MGDMATATVHQAKVADIDERASWFDQSPTPAIICDNAATLIFRNHAAETLIRRGLIQVGPLARVRLVFAAPLASAKRTPIDPLRQAMQSNAPVRDLIPLPTGGWLVISITPFATPVGQMFCLRAREAERGSSIDLSALAAQFGITDSELPVLNGIALATCPKEISRMMGLSVHTIRAHLRTIYAKIGVNSITEAQNKVLCFHYNLELI
jgi:DNA-binding CsgD family transcriptional regulator